MPQQQNATPILDVAALTGIGAVSRLALATCSGTIDGSTGAIVINHTTTNIQGAAYDVDTGDLRCPKRS